MGARRERSAVSARAHGAACAQLDELAQALPAPQPHAEQLARIAQLRADNEAVGAELEAELLRAGAPGRRATHVLPCCRA